MRPLSGTVAALLLTLLLPALSAQAADAPAGEGCSDPLAVVTAFYNAADAGRVDLCVRLLVVDATVDTWATGVNGYVMARRHLAGRAEISRRLAETRGLRRTLPDSAADGPVYHATRTSVSGDTVRFMLEPDRARPNGRPYNPFNVEAVLRGCLISSLTVIERVTWL
jgi:hypothetical protein